MNQKDKLIQSITLNIDKIWKPKASYKFKNMNVCNSSTWIKSSFALQKPDQRSASSSFQKDKFDVTHINEEPLKDKQLFRAFKVDLDFTKKQKRIINRWMNAGIKMYNKTIDLLKNKHEENCSFFTIQNLLKNDKRNIINSSAINPIKSKKPIGNVLYTGIPKIPVHVIDKSIKLACSNLKSALSNKENGNISHFRLRHWKFGKKVKLLGIEKGMFRKDTIFPSIFKKVKAFRDNISFDLSTIKCDSKLFSSDGKYYLLVSEKINNEIKQKEEKPVSIDLGVRTFITGISNDEIIKIGTNNIDKLNVIEDNITKAKNNHNKRREKQHRAKLKNMVDELHWKSINYLINNYSTVIIGKLSTKNAVENGKSKLISKMKTLMLSLSFYKFFQRLIYKCEINRIKLKIVNESYTSKICSCCTNCKDDLGSSKIYKCDKCGIVMDRDVNGARGIYFKSFPIIE